MAEFPAMPVYIDALVADAGHLSDAEFGLYLRLLFLMWRSPSGDGTIPNDDAWLARHLKMTVAGVSSDLRPIIREFCQTRGPRLTQRRLQRELIKCREYSKRQSDRAKLRWDKDKPPSRRNARPAMHPNPTRAVLTTENSTRSAGLAEEREQVQPPVDKQIDQSLSEQKPEKTLMVSPQLTALLERRGWNNGGGR